MGLDQLLDTASKLVTDGATPACQVAVARDGELLCFETFGEATNNTRFSFFSATKPIVASAAWLLIGDGVLDISRPVAHYVPEFASNGKEIVTVEQVLLHTAGFPNAPMDLVEGADPVTRIKHFTDWELEWVPGTRFEYHSASAHWVLVEIIERLSGDADFRDVIEERICRPLDLPRLLGIPEEEQDDIAAVVPVATDPSESADALRMNEPAVRAAGVPGGGAIMTAATMARYYQALLQNPGGLWAADVLADATSNIRCTLPEALFNVAVNRSIGLVIAGDDGKHQLRYAVFGRTNSPGAFGHAGVHMQIAWGDPATGISFAFCKNGLETDLLAEAVRVVPLSDIAAALD